MSGHKPWSEISAKLRADPERPARIEQREQAIEAELTIEQLYVDSDTAQESIYRQHQEPDTLERGQAQKRKFSPGNSVPFVG